MNDFSDAVHAVYNAVKLVDSENLDRFFGASIILPKPNGFSLGFKVELSQPVNTFLLYVDSELVATFLGPFTSLFENTWTVQFEPIDIDVYELVDGELVKKKVVKDLADAIT